MSFHEANFNLHCKDPAEVSRIPAPHPMRDHPHRYLMHLHPLDRLSSMLGGWCGTIPRWWLDRQWRSSRLSRRLWMRCAAKQPSMPWSSCRCAPTDQGGTERLLLLCLLLQVWTNSGLEYGRLLWTVEAYHFSEKAVVLTSNVKQQRVSLCCQSVQSVCQQVLQPMYCQSTVLSGFHVSVSTGSGAGIGAIGGCRS